MKKVVQVQVSTGILGHMAKTKRQIIEDLKLIDVVVEVLDARIPVSSHNPDLDGIIKNKKKIVLLNKSDLAEEKENLRWVEYFKNKNVKAVIVDSNSGKGIEQSIKAIKEIMNDELQKQIAKGKIGKTIRIMILGIPNVGKSSYINRATKKVSAKVGNRPGVTVQKQWIKLDKQIEMLDTPGVLWPKFQTDEIALNLAFTGTIKDDIMERTEIAYYLLKYLLANYRTNLLERYKLEDSNYEEDVAGLMEIIGQKRGAIVSGGKVDLEKVSRIILDDFRTGKFGKISLEKVKQKVELYELFNIEKTEIDVKTLSPLTWAYVGDCVYELYVRTHLVNKTRLKPHKLHIEAIKYVKAEAQAYVIEKIVNNLTEEEQDIVRRTRNTENHHLPKNATPKDYMYATAYEGLIGYLYLTKNEKRMKEILDISIKMLDEQTKSVV